MRPGIRECARQLKRETLTLYFACRDTRTSWYANAFAGAIVAYALSPIDLIPDFVPVLGYLDEVVLVPLGIALAIRMTAGPRACRVPRRSRAGRVPDERRERARPAGASHRERRADPRYVHRHRQDRARRGGRAIASAIRIRSDRTLTEFVVP